MKTLFWQRNERFLTRGSVGKRKNGIAYYDRIQIASSSKGYYF
jgi:hypothetical protein